MRQLRRSSWLVALLLVLALVAAACGGDDDDDEGTTDTTAAEEEIPTGGTLVIGAEQEPDCTDWIGSCSGASWGTWTMGVTTLPRLFDIVNEDGEWQYAPSPVLDGEPKLETEPKQKVTYKIAEEAKWSDGTPITSSDIKYTWDQIVNGEDIYDRTGYANIESVDDSDPKTIVITFKEPYADWKGLFNVQFGFLPKHLLEGKDRNAELANGYKWSGGPWMIEEWAKGSQVTLVPNPNWWGEKPKLDKVIFKFITDTAAEFQAFKAGEVLAIYPQPQLDAVEQIQAGIPGVETITPKVTASLEALWINHSKTPVDDVKVRQAIAYSLDRDAVVKRLFGGIGIEEAMNTLNPNVLETYTDVDAFADYKKDLDKVEELMTSAGWQKGTDGIWAKGGQKANLEIKTTAGNKRRELTEQIVQQQLKEAGFNLTINNQAAGDLFGDQLPKGDFMIGLYAQVNTTLSPSHCNLFCSKNIPSEANNFSGQNWQRINVPEIDPLLATVDNSLDEDERIEAQKKADAIEAENVFAIPLDPLPNIPMWNERVVGPIGENPIFGPFWNVHLWGLKQ